MLIRNDNGTYIAGPLDAIFILHHAQTGRYHAALFLERSFPGPVQPLDDVKVVRLMSHGHHTEGSDTLEGAQAHVDDFKQKIDVHGNVFREPIPWDGRHGVLLLRENWRRDPDWRPEGSGPHARPGAAPSSGASSAQEQPVSVIRSGVTAPVVPEDEARIRFALLELD